MESTNLDLEENKEIASKFERAWEQRLQSCMA